MKRRDFLKFLGIAPLAPSVLMALPKKPEPKIPIKGQAIDLVFYDEKPAPWRLSTWYCLRQPQFTQIYLLPICLL